MTAFRRLAVGAVLLALLASTVYSLGHEKLFEQFIWSRAGLQRFLIFTGCYWLAFTLVSLWKPAVFPLAAGLCALAFTVAAAGAIPTAVVILVLFASLVLGEWMLPPTDPWLAMLLGLSVYMTAVSLAALVPVNYPPVYLAALVAPVLARPRAALAWIARAKSLARPLRLTRPEQLAAGALIFVLLLHWLAALEPEVGADALSMHLAVPSTLARAHVWDFDITRQLWAVMPKGASWCFALCYLLGGESAARLFNFALLACIAALLLGAIRRWLLAAPALLLTALFAATPMVQLVTGSLFVENLWAVLSFAAFLALDSYRDSQRAHYLYLACALLGAGVATKAIALAFVPPFLWLALWILWRARQDRPVVSRAALASACLLIFAAPPYLTAYAKTGNPVFPYLAGIFPSRFPALQSEFPGPPPAPHLSARIFYDLTFRTALFREVQNGAIGFQYFLLLPAAIFLLSRKTPYLARAGAFTLLAFSTISLAADAGARYQYPILPFATLWIASAFAALRGLSPRLYRLAIAVAAALLCLDLYFLPSSNWMFKDFVSNPASNRARTDYITAHAPERNLIAYLNRAHPGVPVAFFESDAIAGLAAPAVATTWHTVDFYLRMLAAKTAPDCLSIVAANSARFVIAPRPGSPTLVKTTPMEAFLKYCTSSEQRSGNFFAGRVSAQCSPAWNQIGPAQPAGDYDDTAAGVLYRDVWFRGQFPAASGSTLTYSNTPGASFVFRFTGAEARYVYTKAFNRGIAEIKLDGVSQGAEDLYAPSIAWQASRLIRAPSPGDHTLEIRVTGRKNPFATAAYVDLDALQVR